MVNDDDVSTEEDEHLGDLVGQRVQIGTQFVTSHAAADGALDLKNPLSRDATLLPFRHRVSADAKAASKLGLRDDFKNRTKGTVLHLGDYVHRQLSSVNHLLIARRQPVMDHKPMVDIPKPELFGSFGQWLEAARKATGLTKAQVGKVGGKSAQAATRWFKSKGVRPESLQKLADWGGTEYAILRSLLDGKPISSGKRRSSEIALRSPDTHRIARKLDLLAANPDSLQDIEAMVDHHLQKQAKQQKRG